MSLLKKGGIVAVGTVSGAALAYVLNPLLIGPRLGPEGVALVGTFLSLSCIFSFVYLPISTIVTRFVSEFFAHQKTAEAGAFILYLQKKVGLYGLLVILTVLLATKPIMGYLHLEFGWPVFFALALAYIFLIERIFIASFQGLQRFHHQTVNLILDPTMRLILGASLLFLGFKAAGIMAAYLAGHIAVIVFSSFLLKDVLQSAKGIKVSMPHDLGRFSLPATFYAFFASFAVSTDNLLAKHFFPAHDAGTFIAAMTLARASGILIYPVSAVAYSLMSHADSQKKRVGFIFLQAVGLLTLCFAAMEVVFFLFPEWIVRLTYGKSFGQTVSLLGLSGLAFAPVGYTLLLANFNLAKKQFCFVYGLAAGVLIQIALLINFHTTVAEFMKANIAGGAAILVLSLAGTIFDQKRGRPSNAAEEIHAPPIPEP